MGGRETRGTSYMRGRGRGGGGWWRRTPPLLLLPPPYTICWPGHRQLRGMVRPWTSTEVGIMQWPMLVVQLLAAGGVGGREAAVRRQHTAARTRARQQGWVASCWQLLPRPSAPAAAGPQAQLCKAKQGKRMGACQDTDRLR